MSTGSQFELSDDSLDREDSVEIQKSINKAIDSLAGFSDEVKKEKNNDIKSMIHYYDGLTKNIEDRRTRIAEFSLQILAISVTALGLIMAVGFISLVKIPIILVLLLLVIMSLVKLREYQQQSSFRYPFLKYPEYSNRWKWFYYGNRYIPEINYNPFTANQTKRKDEVLYLKALNLFIDNYSTENLSEEIKNNVVQLFLLQIHNFYKNRFYLRLLDYDLRIPRYLFRLIIAYIVIISVILLTVPTLREFLLTKTF